MYILKKCLWQGTDGYKEKSTIKYITVSNIHAYVAKCTHIKTTHM